MNIPYNLNPKAILDIGANIGEFAEKCKKMWSNAFIYCIEML
jgi:hypothetical protein